jgi:hypothetical protein
LIVQDIADNKSIQRRTVPYSDEGPGAPPQYLTKDLLKLINKHTPHSRYCVVGESPIPLTLPHFSVLTKCDIYNIMIIGITMEDLYPEEDWNFVFGEGKYTTNIINCHYLIV